MSNFSEKLKELRLEKGLIQDELAKKMLDSRTQQLVHGNKAREHLIWMQ